MNVRHKKILLYHLLSTRVLNSKMLIRNTKIVIKIFKKEKKKTCISRNCLVVRDDLTQNIKWRVKTTGIMNVFFLYSLLALDLHGKSSNYSASFHADYIFTFFCIHKKKVLDSRKFLTSGFR